MIVLHGDLYATLSFPHQMKSFLGWVIGVGWRKRYLRIRLSHTNPFIEFFTFLYSILYSPSCCWKKHCWSKSSIVLYYVFHTKLHF